MYILCFLYQGTIPMVEYVHNQPDFEGEEDEQIYLFNLLLRYRKDNKEEIHKKIKSLLPNGMRSAFSYIVSLSFNSEPDYNLIKLFFASSIEDEVKAFTSTLQIENESAARNILYCSQRKNN